MTKKIWFFASAVLFLSSSALAQQVLVRKNVNLRSGPSTAKKVLAHLHPGEALILLSTSPTGGFYHVKTANGRTGWAWSKNLRIRSGEGSAASLSRPQGPAASQEAAYQCDDSLWNHVYHPQRLIVKQRCIAVTGVIVDATRGRKRDGVRHEADGDTHGWLEVDPSFSDLLDAGNMDHEGGNLVFEIVCKFPVTQADAVPACPPSYKNTIELPPIGSHVRIVGSYVQDTNHGKWMEIHPVSSVELLPD